MITLTLLLACSPESAPVDTWPGDTGELIPSLEISADAELSETIPTVITVTWESELDEPGEVDFGDTLEHRATGQLGEDGLWRAVLVGSPPEHIARFRVRHGEEVSSTQELMTGSKPDWAPRNPDITGEGASGFLATGFRSDDGRGAVIFDSEGRPVWWWSLEEFGEDAYTSRVQLGPDGEAVWFSIISLRSAGADADVMRGLVRVSLDGSEVEHWELPDHHHDFWLHEDGSVAFLSVEEEGEAGETWTFDDLKVRDPDGTIRQVWSSSATQDREESPAWLNHIEYVAETDSYWIGAKARNSIYQVDGSSGETLMVVTSTAEATVTVDEAFYEQHGFDVRGDELLVFDNGRPSSANSRALRFQLDADAGTAEKIWEYSADPALYTPMLGDALELPDGEILINWTSQSHVAQVTPAGELLSTWQYDDLEMLTFGRFYRAVSP